MTTFSSWVKASLKICSKMFPERFDKETMKQEQIVLERSTRLNLDPWPHASPYQRGVGVMVSNKWFDQFSRSFQTSGDDDNEIFEIMISYSPREKMSLQREMVHR